MWALRSCQRWSHSKLSISPVQESNHSEGSGGRSGEPNWNRRNSRWKILSGPTCVTSVSHLWSVDPFCCLDGSLQPRGPNTYIWDMQQFLNCLKAWYIILHVHQFKYTYLRDATVLNTHIWYMQHKLLKGPSKELSSPVKTEYQKKRFKNLSW